MNESNFGTLSRNAKRALAIIGAQDIHPALDSQGTKLRSLAGEFFAADENLRALQSVSEELAGKVKEAVAALSREYDIARAGILADALTEPVGVAASRCNTPDDLLVVAEAARQALQRHIQEKWAKPLLAALVPKLDAAAKAWSRSLIAQQDQQKVRNTRLSAAGELSAALVPLRRLLKAVHGPKSKEYCCLKASRIRGQTGDGTGEPAKPAGQQPVPPVPPTPPQPT